MNNKALLVGINAYPNPSNHLRGCINDIVDMEYFIASKNKVYSKENIRTITDKEATKKGILTALNWLLLGASAGDQILFQYSGHGAQIPSHNPAIEKDGLDEIICPYDFNGEYAAETAISDKEFAKIFAKIPQGVHFVWISDSCHSEDLSRKHEVVESNYDLKDTRFRRFNHKDFLHQEQVVAPVASIGSAIIPLHGALLSGCASHQLSADAYINNRFNGAFTHYLIKNLSLYGQDASMQEIVKYVNIDLMDNDYDQNPQSEGLLATQKFFE
ncbi:MAG: caspase family protein [Chitinophagaceae bacterium]|nr:caspase family protein [Chitinophagaceae bacterium]